MRTARAQFGPTPRNKAEAPSSRMIRNTPSKLYTPEEVSLRSEPITSASTRPTSACNRGAGRPVDPHRPSSGPGRRRPGSQRALQVHLQRSPPPPSPTPTGASPPDAAPASASSAHRTRRTESPSTSSGARSTPRDRRRRLFGGLAVGAYRDRRDRSQRRRGRMSGPDRGGPEWRSNKRGKEAVTRNARVSQSVP